MSEFCDLHTHTIASDGSDSPSELIKKAKEAGLKAVAITDHDTLDGLKEGEEASKKYGVELVPGVELSLLAPRGNMHLLGYYVNQDSKELHSVLKSVQDARAQRNPKIVEKLNQLGLKITMDELEKMAQGGQIGRPHIARMMVEKGYVKSVSEAFDKYLKKDGPAYVPKSILTPKEAIEAIHAANGVAVLAHPISLDPNPLTLLDEFVERWVSYGLDGIECYYSEHTPDFTEYCIALCKRFGLIITGGSDYHGKAKPHIKLGVGKGNLQIPYSLVEGIKKRWQKLQN